MTDDAHSRNLRLHRLVDASATFFITKSLYPKRPLLDGKLRQVIVSAFAYALARERIYLRAFVVMPDHWHALLATREPWTLPKFMHSFMSHVAAKTASDLSKNGSAWQDSYYETLVKTARQFGFVATYIEENPVKKGLVERAEEWDASSASRRDLVTDPWPWLFDKER
jgi:REP element-mobilizing transposase RayT